MQILSIHFYPFLSTSRGINLIDTKKKLLHVCGSEWIFLLPSHFLDSFLHFLYLLRLRLCSDLYLLFDGSPDACLTPNHSDLSNKKLDKEVESERSHGKRNVDTSAYCHLYLLHSGPNSLADHGLHYSESKHLRRVVAP